MDFETFEDFILNNSKLKTKYFEFNSNIESDLSNLVYIPTDNRLSHTLKTYLEVKTIDFNQDKWSFKVLDKFGGLIAEILLNLENPVEKADLEAFELIVQVCLNGDNEKRDNLDRLGIVTNSSVWRCEYCGGVFGHTYNDCIQHEEHCVVNPKNIKQ